MPPARTAPSSVALERSTRRAILDSAFSELDHDYLWRYMRNVPARGQIGIFNRSYYEEVLVVKVHQELLQRQKLHPSLVTRDARKALREDIDEELRALVRNGVLVLRILPAPLEGEQKRRFLERLDNPAKNCGEFSTADVAERAPTGTAGLRGGDPPYRHAAGAWPRGQRTTSGSRSSRWPPRSCRPSAGCSCTTR
ncbi:MAG: hypothetical protein U1F72_04130 [Gammaproteobacteria bacterium]